MAGYSFETISADQAAAFGTGDYLFFLTQGATASQVMVAPFTSTSGVLSGSGINVTYGGKTVTFNNNLSTASQTNHILFNDNSHLVIGTTGVDTYTYTATTQANGSPALDPYTVYMLSGNDTINFAASAAGQQLYLNGGFGSDSIVAGNANAHIYGNSMAAQQGATQNGDVDGNDTITAGTGSNYIQGNSGEDLITVGSSTTGTGSTAQTTIGQGYNRVFGGADSDTINITGNGHNAVNGNLGNDTITDTGFGDNTLRGGQGDDLITGGSGHSVLMGDVGNDTIVVHGRNGENVTTGSGTSAMTTGQHINVITGGTGSDTFDFSAAGAGQAARFGQVTYYQEITDFTQGTDKLVLTTNPTETGDVGHSTTIFGSVSDAEVYARTQLNGQGVGGEHVVEALSVGSANNTYLFYTETGNTAVTQSEVANLGIIHLDGVTAANVTYTDFNSGQ